MSTVSPAGVAAADAAERELACYDGVRAGRRGAFAALATELDPVLRDLAMASGADDTTARLLVRRAWAVALPGLDLFAWRSSLRAWIAGVLVGLTHPDLAAGDDGEAALARGRAPGGGRGSRTGSGGPADWSDLPWGARWSVAAWAAVEDARAALPSLRHQALVLADVHGWQPRDAADAVGLTAARYARTLGLARLAVHDALAAGTGEEPAGCGHDPVEVLGGSVPWSGASQGGSPQEPACSVCATLVRRWLPVSALLAATASRPPPAPDPEVMALFRRWRASRRRGPLRWLAVRR